MRELKAKRQRIKVAGLLAVLAAAAVIAPVTGAAVDSLDTNLTALVCLDRVERALICREQDAAANRNGILRTIGELERWINPVRGRFERAPDWAKRGVRGADAEQLANFSFAYARLLKHAGTLYGFPAYAARGRTLEERLIRENGGVPAYPFFAWRTPTVLEQYRCYSPIDASASKLLKTYLALYRAEGRPLDLAKARALGDSMVNNQDDNGRIRTYWIPEPGDDDPLAGAIRLPLGGDWFNCMASDVEALSELAHAVAAQPKEAK